MYAVYKGLNVSNLLSKMCKIDSEEHNAQFISRFFSLATPINGQLKNNQSPNLGTCTLNVSTHTILMPIK